ncbi:helix-turn-helix transcriptional regulator [Lactobacillus sp. ESL0703]|uniref:helix-turn-helix domain-containing protein n=1 Tax=Lactobacillus sp. ESL0703 TaxID=2983218 RepID=UPI0023F86695|nr:helix-turn-helix transcriptional regulator [Lactobacillus sp. ESL0703]MDF7668548.1 helix-turn-helix transcriptional regulator [Lactobacillus sp. ESL0703]
MMLWNKIQIILNKKHWSLAKLAEESDVNYETLKKYKFSGQEPNFSKVCKIADALSISLDELRC